MFKLTTDLAKSGDSCRNKTFKKKKKKHCEKSSATIYTQMVCSRLVWKNSFSLELENIF